MKPPEGYSRLKTEAYAGLMKRSDSKKWIRMVEATPYVLGRNRGNLLIAVNTGMRILDDISDRDRPSPEGYTPLEYLEEKRTFIKKPEQPRDDLDALFKYCYDLADREGLSIENELDAFFEYFLFDAARYGTGDTFTRDELDKAYDSCDITGTIRGSLMCFGDNPEKAELLMPLGKAVRTYYNLRDYEADIAAGFVNIPIESIEEHSISTEDLPDRFSNPVRAWFHEEARLGLQRLEEHNEMMKREKFKWIGKLALPIAYTNPANAYLQSVLANEK